MEFMSFKIEWTINISQIIMGLSVLMGVAYVAGQLKQNLSQLIHNQENHDRRIADQEHFREEIHSRVSVLEAFHVGTIIKKE
jgi:hypothetical protein